MGVFDKLKGRVTEELAERAAKLVAKQGAEAAKAVARKGAEAAVDAAKGAGRVLEEALFGEREESGSEGTDAKEPLDPKEKKKREDEVGERLRAADRRVKEREEADRRARAEREAKRSQTEREIDDELARLKKKIER